jgi:hypothetical protein
LGQELPVVEVEDLLLVGLAGVDVDEADATVEQLLDRCYVHGGICADRPVPVDLRQR